MVHQPRLEMSQVASFKSMHRLLDIFVTLPTECPAVGEPPRQHKLQNCHRKTRLILLRDNRDIPRDLTPRKTTQSPAIQLDHPDGKLNGSIHRPYQRRLSG